MPLLDFYYQMLERVANRTCARCDRSPPTVSLVRGCAVYEAVPEATFDGWICVGCLLMEEKLDAYEWARGRKAAQKEDLVEDDSHA